MTTFLFLLIIIFIIEVVFASVTASEHFDVIITDNEKLS